MKLIYRRETLLQNISFMAIMSAINLIFVLLNWLLPIVSLFIMLFLPLVSTLTTLLCNKKYYLIYFATSLGLGLLVGINIISDVFFYLLPALISGFIFGILIEKKINFIWIISLGTIIQFICFLTSSVLISLITKFDYLNTINVLFRTTDLSIKEVVPLLFIFISSLSQILLSFFLLKEELKKFNIFISYKTCNFDLFLIMCFEILSVLLCMLFAFINLGASYLFLVVFICFSLLNIAYGILEKKKRIYIPTIISVFVSLLTFGAIHPYIPTEHSFLLLGIYFLLGSIPTILYFSSNKYFKKDLNM